LEISVKAIALRAACAVSCVHAGAVPLDVLMLVANPELPLKSWYVL
jgi:hypothetical protein